MGDVFRSDRWISVFGASGFLGRHVIRVLAREGWKIRAFTRTPSRAYDVPMMGQPGQILVQYADFTKPDSLKTGIEGTEAILNLVGILREKGNQTFDIIQKKGAETLATLAQQAGHSRFIHISALGINSSSASLYARTKYAGEEAVRHIFPDAICIRPSLLFGPEDHFFNRFAKILRFSPFLPLLGGGNTLFQPVYVSDVAEGIAKLLQDPYAKGQIYEFGGPTLYSFKELLQYLCTLLGYHRWPLSIPFSCAKGIAMGLEIADMLTGRLLPEDYILTLDQIRVLQETSSIVSENARTNRHTLEGIGILPQALEAIVPAYIRKKAQ